MDSTGNPDLESDGIEGQPGGGSSRGELLETSEGKSEGAFLSWTDLTLTVPPGKTILSHLSGYAEPSHLLAIMGPSGSGKSTLLSTLAGRFSKNVSVTGQILLNSETANLSYGNVASFLDQEVTLMGTLTVYETLYYSAKLRFPDTVDQQETEKIVVNAIRQVGLQDATNTRVGTWYERGISGGEKRRVSIAIALLTSPYLMFLDEPTTGLDSAAAFHVVKVLKALAQERGVTILCSIHQPSSEVFEIFDDLCLLSDGLQIYFGPLRQSAQFFDRNGLPCPPMRNLADHYLHCVNSDFDRVERTIQKSLSQKEGRRTLGRTPGRIPGSGRDSRTSLERSASSRSDTMSVKQAVEMLTESYSSSEEKRAVKDRVANASYTGGDKFVKRGHAGLLKQCVYLTIRSFINMNRDVGYYWLRIALFFTVSIGLGTVYYNLDHSFESIQAKVSCLFFFSGFLAFLAVGGVPSHIEVMKVYTIERLNGHYGAGAFVVGSTISPLPYILVIAATDMLVVYPMIKFQSGASRVIYAVLNLFSNLVAAEFVMAAICSIVNNYLVGIVFGAGFQAILILGSGFFRLPDSMPDPFWKYPLYYVDFVTMTLQGFIQNEFLGTIYEGPTASVGRIPGHYVAYDILEVEHNSKWVKIVYQWCVALAFRVFFFLVLKSKEVTFPASLDDARNRLLQRSSAPQKPLLITQDDGPPASQDGDGAEEASTGSPTSAAIRRRR